MFLNEPCPLVVKVRTKIAELLILRKMEAVEIYSIYPNIWKRINKKSLFNMEKIYLIIKKIIIDLSNKYNIKMDKKYNKTKIKKKNNKKTKKINNKIKTNISQKNEHKIKINELNDKSKIQRCNNNSNLGESNI